MKVGFIGLGTMGFSMCYGMYSEGYSMILPTYRKEEDLSGGFTPFVPDKERKRERYDEMLSNGCSGAASPAELFAGSDVIMISMPTSRQVEMNVYGEEGIMEHAKPGTVVIDLTSADASSTRKIAAELGKKGIAYLDAPISGGQAGAINQTLAVMVGGREEVFNQMKDIFDTIGDPAKVTYVGPSGAGDALKCANNFLSCTCLLASAEALAVAAKAGIDPKVAAEVIGNGGGSSNAVTYKFPKLLFKGQGMNMPVDLMMKDLGLFNALAKDMKVPNFYGSVSYNMFDIQSARGKGGEDFACVVSQMEEWTGVKITDLEKK